MPRKKIKTLEIPEQVTKTQIAGKEYTNIKSIDALFGIDKKSYKQETIEAYETYLSDLTDIDLRQHARDFEVPSDSNKEVIVNQLLKLYRLDSFRKDKSKTSNVQVVTSELNDKINKIWND